MNSSDIFPASNKILAALKGIIISLVVYFLLRLAGINLGVYTIFFIFAVWLIVFLLSSYGPKNKLNLGKIFSALLYLGIIFAVILVIATYLPPLFDKSLENKIYVKSQSGDGIVGYEENSIRLVGGNSKEGTAFTLKTTEPINGGPSFTAWISGTNNSTIGIKMLDIKGIGSNAEFNKVAISSQKYGYAALYKGGTKVAEITDGKIKEKIENIILDEHKDRREYDIEIEVHIPQGGIVNLENVTIESEW